MKICWNVSTIINNKEKIKTTVTAGSLAAQREEKRREENGE
jgi:hypothetical protein